jgi:hypothetical protein
MCSADDVFGMTWDESGIVFGRGRGGIARCPAAGGVPEQLVDVEDGQEAHGPQILPGGSSNFERGVDEPRSATARLSASSSELD